MESKLQVFLYKIRIVMGVSMIVPVFLFVLLLMTQSMAKHNHEKEIITLIGAVAQENEAAAVRGIQQYFARQSVDASEQYTLGMTILSHSGYAQTATRFLWARFIGFFLSEVNSIFLFIIVFLWLFFVAKEGQYYSRELSKQDSTEKNRQKRKDEYYQTLVKEIEQYEGNIYHQIKTQITAISLCLQNLTNEVEELQQRVAYQMAQSQIQKLSRLCSLFLRDQQLSSNKTKFHYQAHSLTQIVEYAAKMVQPLSDWKKTSIQTLIEIQDDVIVCDEVWLSECIITILENAVEHTRVNCPIILHLQEEVSLHRISILSRGEILGAEQMSQLFDRFYTQNSNHFGIGLHMAMTIAQMHHGILWAENTRNGVQFILELPKLNGAKIYDTSPFCKAFGV